MTEKMVKEPIIFPTGEKSMFRSFQTSLPRKQTLDGDLLELVEASGLA